LSFVVIRLLLILVIKGYYAPRFDIVLCPHSRTQSQIPGLNLLRHQVQLCTSTPTTPWYLRCAGRVVQDRSRQQHKNGPVGRLYLWKEWSTRTAVDASSTQALTLPFSSSHNVRSLPHFWKFAHCLSQERNRSG
jgi:hypothetical protein